MIPVAEADSLIKTLDRIRRRSTERNDYLLDDIVDILARLLEHAFTPLQCTCPHCLHLNY